MRLRFLTFFMMVVIGVTLTLAGMRYSRQSELDAFFLQLLFFCLAFTQRIFLTVPQVRRRRAGGRLRVRAEHVVHQLGALHVLLRAPQLLHLRHGLRLLPGPDAAAWYAERYTDGVFVFPLFLSSL